MWVWQQENWPEFEFDSNRVLSVMEEAVRAVSPLVLLAKELDQHKQLELESLVLLDEALSTAKIEGEILDRETVRSSIANRMGIGRSTRMSKSSQAFIDVLFESVRDSSGPLRESDLFKWHQMMFLEKPLIHDLIVGQYRQEKMQVVSGRFGNQKVHFEAPCTDRACVANEMRHFLNWLNGADHLSGYIKAAIAKFWFVTIHPFDDGNGRFSRIIAERCLAEVESTNIRLYSLSTEIERNRVEYYDLLELHQKGYLDMTDWIVWFLQQVRFAAKASMKKLDKIRLTTLFWDKHRKALFNDRQRKLIIRLLETSDFAEGISRGKYKNLVGASDATAARDLKDLFDKKILRVVGVGRSTKYLLSELV